MLDQGKTSDSNDIDALGAVKRGQVIVLGDDGGLVPGARGAVLAVLLRTGTPLTGRQIHGLVSHDFGLWSVQEALKSLTQLGLVETQTIGRAGVHTINEGHAAVGPLRALVDPLATLTAVIGEVTDANVQSVLLFGSIARGEATVSSDIDLAVIAQPGWGRPRRTRGRSTHPPGQRLRRARVH